MASMEHQIAQFPRNLSLRQFMEVTQFPRDDYLFETLWAFVSERPDDYILLSDVLIRRIGFTAEKAFKIRQCVVNVLSKNEIPFTTHSYFEIQREVVPSQFECAESQLWQLRYIKVTGSNFKILCMMVNNDFGKKVIRYYIQLENLFQVFLRYQKIHAEDAADDLYDKLRPNYLEMRRCGLVTGPVDWFYRTKNKRLSIEEFAQSRQLYLNRAMFQLFHGLTDQTTKVLLTDRLIREVLGRKGSTKNIRANTMATIKRYEIEFEVATLQQVHREIEVANPISPFEAPPLEYVPVPRDYETSWQHLQKMNFIRLSAFNFKKLLLLSRTPAGKEARRYMLQIEKLIFEYIKYEQEFAKKRAAEYSDLLQISSRVIDSFYVHQMASLTI